MAYSDRQLLKIQEAGALGTLASGGTVVANAVATVSAAHSDDFPFSKAADDGMAATATAETFTGIYIPRAFQVNSIVYSATTGGITADNTNNATITVSYRDSAGANLTTIGTLVTNLATGNVVQGAGKAFTLTNGAPVQVPAGATITWSIAKGGTGVIVRAGGFTIDGEWV